MGNDGRKKLEIVKVAHCSPPIVLALRLFAAPEIMRSMSGQTLLPTKVKIRYYPRLSIIGR